MPTVAYLRCSSDPQDTLRQREAIQRSGLKIDQWLEDHESRDRPTNGPTSNASCVPSRPDKSIPSWCKPWTASASEMPGNWASSSQS